MKKISTFWSQVPHLQLLDPVFEIFKIQIIIDLYWTLNF